MNILIKPVQQKNPQKQDEAPKMSFKKTVSPLIGGKVLFAEYLDDEKKEKDGLFSKDGELLNDAVYFDIDVRNFDHDRKNVVSGAPYVDTELVMRGY